MQQITTLGFSPEEFQAVISAAVQSGLSTQAMLPEKTIVDRNFLVDNFGLTRRRIESLERSGKLIPRREDNRHKYTLGNVLRAINLR